jgi:hypothetical protein
MGVSAKEPADAALKEAFVGRLPSDDEKRLPNGSESRFSGRYTSP